MNVEQQRTVTVQRLQKSYEYENTKPVETLYLRHFDREIPFNSTYSSRTTTTKTQQVSRPIPLFVSQFKDLHVNCGEKAYFSARVQPENDPSLKVEFFFNNQKLRPNSKISISLNYGLVELTILNVDINDAGIYLCRVYSENSGEAVSAAALSVTSKREYSHSIKAEFNQNHGQQIKQHKLIEEKTSQHTIDEQSKHLLQQQMLESQRKLLIREEESRRPTFLGTMNDLVLPEDSNCHFHARLEPSNDSRIRIEWYLNNQPLVTSSKISSIFSQGYVALNIYCIKKSDEGLYTCVATNVETGHQARTSATLQVIPHKTEPIIYDNSSKLYEIERQTVEQCNRIKQDLIELNKPEEKPIFITQLRDQLNKPEDSTALFEAHLEPQSDPSMIVKWYKDGVELENASRISTFFNFGYVSLKIRHLILRDSGVYSCVAQNDSGHQAQTSARLTVIENQTKIITSSNLENGWDQIQRLESTKYVKHEELDTEIDEKPKFLTGFLGKTDLYEGQTACLEAKFVPVSDPNLKVEIFKDGQPLEHANRISIFFGFGYVSLKIHFLNISRDSGYYEAVITNRVGTDRVSTRLNVGVKSLEIDDQYEEGLKKIQQLESSTKYRREEYEEIEIQEKPRFLSPLNGPDRLNEGQNLHLETKLVPVNDPSMKVEFYFNDRLLSIGHRFKTFYEFGIVAVDILDLIPEDSGRITVRAINNYGEDSVSKQITVKSRQAIDSTKMFDVNIDQVRMIRNEQMQQTKELFDEARQKLVFHQPLTLRTRNPHVERSNAHFDAKIEHCSDPTIKIEFFHNGQPLLTGSRVLPRYEFGLITLDIMCLTLTDAGTYTLVVSNELGSISSSAHLEVIEESNIISSSQFPESLDKIQYLEEHSKYSRQELIEETRERLIYHQPLTLRTKNPHIERSNAHFDAKISNYSDPTIKIEFFHNGNALLTGSRVLTRHEFGLITLDIMCLTLSDAGTYTLVVSNEITSISSSATLEVIEESGIISSSQFPESLDKIQYLEGHNKYSRQEFEDIAVSEKPRFLVPLTDQKVYEHDRAHFETKLEPQNDPTMKIDFLKDGEPIEKANRITTTDNFGFVSIDIRQCTKEIDAGYYEIIATNMHGSDKVGARLEVISKSSIISDNITEDGMRKIHYLENQSKYVREEISDSVSEKPFFLEPLQGPDVLWEGQSCHFETRFRPVGDNTLRVEWFFNDKLLQKGHRFKTYFDFGFISLDILYTYPEDTGRYSVKLYNDLGEAITGKDLLVKAIDSIDRTKNYNVEIDKIREMKMKRKEEEEIIQKEAPVFLTQIQPQIVDERETARFEAQLTPTNDNKLRTEWYYNGELLKAGHRIRTFHNFGLVWLEILDCLKRDEGLYSIKAFNEIGEATSEATLQVRVKPSLILQTQLPPELAGGANEKIKQIEESRSIKETTLEQDQAHVESPMFLEPIQSLVVMEQETAVFRTNLVPTNDPDLVVSWFKDDQPLRTATRIKQTNDFGRITLEISPCYLADEGVYKIQAKNKFGQAEVAATLKVNTDKSIILDSQLPENIQQASINKIAQIEEHQKMKFYEAFTEEQTRFAQIPKFTVEYQENIIDENDSVRFESILTPTHDQSMKIEWYHNGKPLVSSSRRKTFHDFELVALEIRKVAEHDAGVYICRAYNEFGESTYKIVLIVRTKKNVLVDSQLAAQFDHSTQSINRLEQTTVRKTEFHIDDEIGMKPRFITQIQENSEINEGESFQFACQIEPAEDPDLQVIWFKNGEILRTGTRIRQIKQFGQVILKFDWTLEQDCGEYFCKIINKLGSDVTRGVLRMKTKRNVILDPQVPENMSLESIRRLENRHVVEKEIAENPIYPPKFLKPIESLSINEQQTAHFESRLVPTNDSKLEVLWYFAGEPLPTGSRFITRNEFGFVSLDILNCVDTDSGEYAVRAVNDAGEDISKATLHVRSKPSLIYQTQLPNKTMELGIQRLTEMENKVPEPEIDPDLNQAEPTAPEFVQLSVQPESHEVVEGESVRFSARIDCNPKAKVFWVINGETCVNGSKYKISYDGMYHLDIPKTNLKHNGKVEIFAKNLAGEAYRSTTLTVKPRHADYRVVLKNSPRPWYDSKIHKYQVERKQEEVNKVFDEKITPTETVQWKTEQKDENKRVKVQEYLVDEEQIQNEQMIQQNKQINQQQLNQQQQNRQQTREKTFIEKQKETVTKQPKMFTEAETGVHGQQVHTQVSNQVQKQELDNLEITRKLKTIEKRELERRIMSKNIYVKSSDEKITAPRLSVTLEPLEVFEGDRAVFKTHFSGTPKPKVSWYRENFLIQPSNDFQIETTDDTSTLTIRQVYSDDSGEYSVKVENKGGVEISRTNLIVSLPKDLGAAGNPPTFTKTIQNLNGVIGELSRFDAIVVGAKPVEVHWEKNGQKLEPSISYKLLNEGNHYTLLILETSEKDLGLYQCVARNQFGECRCEAQLNLVQKGQATTSSQNQNLMKEKIPVIVEHLSNCVTKEGCSATFRTRISNVKPDQVTWYKNDSLIKPSRFFRISNDRDLFILNITEAYPEDIGTYECRAGPVSTSATLQLEIAENKINLIKPESQVIHEPQSLQQITIQKSDKPTAEQHQQILQQQFQQKQQQQQQLIHHQQPQQQSSSQQQQIQSKPSLIQPPKLQPLTAQCVEKGSTVKFETTFTGVPTPLLTWYKDKKLIKFSKQIQMSQDDNSCCLVMKDVQEDDSGFYTLLAENEAGQSKTTAQLLVVQDTSEIGETVVTTTTKNESDDGSLTQSKPKKKSSKKKK